MPVELRNEQRRARVDTRGLKRYAAQLLRAMGLEGRTLSLLLTDDRRMAKLHLRWMGDPAPTDVLSFSQSPARRKTHDAQPVLLGDIAISAETCLRRGRRGRQAAVRHRAGGQARRRPPDAAGEIRRCLLHGLLHLAGYDHATDAHRRRMEKAARRLQQATGKERLL